MPLPTGGSTVTASKTSMDEIVDGLYIGGAPVDNDAIDKQFDGLVLAAREFQDVFPVHKYPGTYVVHAPLDDARLSREDKVKALAAGLKVYELREAGKKVLSTCAKGVNRSALIAAISLILEGRTAKEAISLIRKKRKPVSGALPLFNPHFVKFLYEIDDAISTSDSRTH
jgi:hypothetical protein